MINDLDMQGWAYLLAPTFQFVNTAGKPLTEGYLEVYIADTRNKYYCACDFDGTLHPFQIPLDSLGSNIVLADPSQAYDVYVYNRFGSLVMSRYNVSPSNAGGSGVLTITISSNDDTVQVVKDGNNYDLSIADTIARIDDIEDRLDEIGDGSVGYAVAHSELASDGLFDLTNDKNKDINYTGDMHGFRLKPGHVYQLNFNAKFDCNNDTNDLISGKFYLDGDNVVSQEWQFNVDNSFEHQESFNGSTVLVIPTDVSYYDVKLKYLFEDEALDLYLNKISIVDVTSIVSQGASGGGGVEYTDGDGIIVDNSNHTINVDMDYINSHLDIDASSILSSAYNYTDTRVSQVSGDLINIIAEATGSLPIPEQVQSDWEEDNTSSPAYIQHKPEVEEVTFEEINLDDYALASAIPDVSNLVTKDELNVASGNIINYVDNSIDNVTNVIESVSGDLQEQINNIPAQVQSDWNESDVDSPAYIDNKPDLSIYATETQLETVSGNIVAMIPEAQVQSDWNQDDDTQVDYIKNKPDEESVEFEEINLSDYALASAVPSIEGLATIAQVSSVSSVLQNEIDNIPEQVNADWESNSGKSEILNKPDLSIYATINQLSEVSGDIISQIPDAQVQSDWNESDNTQPSYINNKPDLSIYATHNEVVNAVSGASGNIINYVNEQIGEIPTQVQSDWAEDDSQDLSYIKNKPTERQLIPGDNISITASGSDYVISSTGEFTQVQSDWTEDDTTDPSYILNKPNELELVAGNNIEIVVSGTNIVISSTASAVTGLDLLYGQFTSDNVSTTATMAKSKGNINVSEGKIQLEQGKSYHITVRGYYQQTNASNSYSPISYVEYITSNTINIDIDRSRTDAQYFELSYDLFNLNSDVDYQVAFSGGAGLVKDLIVEVHSLGGAGTGSSSGGSAIEYDAGYGINISNQVISVDSSIIPNTSTLATKAEVANVSGTIVGMIPNTSNLATKAELNSASANIVGQIPDVSNYATTTDLTNACNNVISMIPELPESANLIAGNNITITASGDDWVISSTASGGGSGETYTAGNGLTLNGNEFSIDTSVVATQSDLGDVEAEVQAVSSAIPTLPQEEEIEFEELDLSNYALASAIPDVSNLATKTEVQEVSAAIPQSSNLIPGDNITITASGDDWVISSTGGASTTYTAGDGIEITNNEISVDNTVALKTDVESVEADIQVVSAAIPTLPLEEEVDFEELNLSNYALASAIPDVSNLATKAEVSTATGDLQSQINNLPSQVQANWTESDDSEPSYILNKPEEINLVAGDNITITVSGSSAIINGQAGGGNSSYKLQYNQIGSSLPIDELKEAIDNHTPIYLIIPQGTDLGIQSPKPNIAMYSEITLPLTQYQINNDGTGAYTFTQSIVRAEPIYGIINNTKYVLEISFLSEKQSSTIRINEFQKKLYNFITESDIPDTSSFATKVELNDYIPYSASGVNLPNSNFSIDVNGQAYKLSKSVVTISSSDVREMRAYFTDGTVFNNGTYNLDLGVRYSNLCYLYNNNNLIASITCSNGKGTIVINNTFTASSCYVRIGDGYPLDEGSGVTLTSETYSSEEYILESELNAVSAAIPDTSDMATQTWVGNQGYLTSIPATYVTDTELSSAVSGLATKNELTTSLNSKQDTLTGITDVQVVQSLPASPVATVLYLIPEV